MNLRRSAWYLITTNKGKMNAKDPNCLGELRGNSSGTEFYIADTVKFGYDKAKREFGGILYNEGMAEFKKIEVGIPSLINDKEPYIWKTHNV